MKTKRFIALILALVMMVSMGVFATANDAPFEFTFEDGRVVEYFLDENMHPYNIIDGEKLHLAIPLPHMLVTDEKLLTVLNEVLPDDPTSLGVTFPGISPFSLPFSPLHLTLNIPYSQNAMLANDNIVTTPVFTWSGSPRSIRFSTSNISPLFSNRDLYIIYSVYYEQSGTWHSTMFSNHASLNVVVASVDKYAQYTFIRANGSMNSCTYSVTVGT